jgi:hypothetical protein
MMVAVRISLDRRRPCLACGAAWRVKSTAPIDARAKGLPAPWDDRGGQCSSRCWEVDAGQYIAGIVERRLRGWDSDDTSRCAQVA